MSATYIGNKACARHGTFIRYRSNGNCADCLREANRRYQAKNRDALLPKKRVWVSEHRALTTVRQAAWQKANYSKTARASRRRATPPWVDRRQIAAFYAATPEGMTVDHIVPLNGDAVCGLHVPWNLQYLSKSANSAKGKRHV